MSTYTKDKSNNKSKFVLAEFICEILLDLYARYYAIATWLFR